MSVGNGTQVPGAPAYSGSTWLHHGRLVDYYRERTHTAGFSLHTCLRDEVGLRPGELRNQTVDGLGESYMMCPVFKTRHSTYVGKGSPTCPLPAPTPLRLRTTLHCSLHKRYLPAIWPSMWIIPVASLPLVPSCLEPTRFLFILGAELNHHFLRDALRLFRFPTKHPIVPVATLNSRNCLRSLPTSCLPAPLDSQFQEGQVASASISLLTLNPQHRHVVETQ